MNITSRIMSLFGYRPSSKSGGSTTRVVIADQVRPEASDTAEMVAKMREDEQVAFSEFTLKACIKRINVFVTTDSQDSRAKFLADQLQDLWERSLDDFLESIAFGRAAFEKLENYDSEMNLNVPSKLEAIPFELSRMELSQGQFNGITVGKGDSRVTLTKEESLWVAIDKNATNPHGKSRFRGAPYRVWQRRQVVVAPGGLEEKFLKRFALRGGKAHVDPVVTDERTGQQIDNLAATAEAYQQLLSGGLTIFPNTTTSDGSKFANDITESPSALDPTPLMNVIDKLDVRVLRAFGIPEKTVIDNGAGSWDLVSLQMLILWAVCEGLLSQIVNAFQEGVIDPSVAANFIQAHGIAIKATFTKPSQQPDSVLAEIAKSLMTSGQLSPVVLSGGVDVRKILEAAGIPVTADLETRLKVILDRLAVAASAPPAPTGSFAMTNAADFRKVPHVPTKEELTDGALSTLNDLWDELLDAAEKKKDEAIRQICREINALHAQVQIAANIVGRLMPIKPRLSSVPAGQDVKPIPLHRAMANILGDGVGDFPPDVIVPLGDPAPSDDGPKWEFTFLDDAIKWLKDVDLVTDEELVRTADEVRRRTFSAPGVNDQEILKTVHQALTESIAAGETPEQFHRRIADATSLTRAQSSTILRTNTKSSAIAGLDATAKKPAVHEAFPYAMLAVTHDGRTRDSHWDARNTIVRVGTREYDVIRNLLEDYNCRCGVILLTEEQAQSRGITTFENLPESVRQDYLISH